MNVTNVYNGTFGVAGGKAPAQYQGTENRSTQACTSRLVKHNRFGEFDRRSTFRMLVARLRR